MTNTSTSYLLTWTCTLAIFKTIQVNNDLSIHKTTEFRFCCKLHFCCCCTNQFIRKVPFSKLMSLKEGFYAIYHYTLDSSVSCYKTIELEVIASVIQFFLYFTVTMRRSTWFPLASLLILLIGTIICFVGQCKSGKKNLTFVCGILFVLAGDYLYIWFDFNYSKSES